MVFSSMVVNISLTVFLIIGLLIFMVSNRGVDGKTSQYFICHSGPLRRLHAAKLCTRQHAVRSGKADEGSRLGQTAGASNREGSAIQQRAPRRTGGGRKPRQDAKLDFTGHQQHFCRNPAFALLCAPALPRPVRGGHGKRKSRGVPAAGG